MPYVSPFRSSFDNPPSPKIAEAHSKGSAPEGAAIDGAEGREEKKKPKIEVKWETGRAYFYRGLDAPKPARLGNYSKSWPDVFKEKERLHEGESFPKWGAPPTPLKYKLARHDDANPIAGAEPFHEEYELNHYKRLLGNHVKNLIPNTHLTRRPTEGEQHVMKDFSSAIRAATLESHGEKSPLKGEFIATYAWKHEAGNGGATGESTGTGATGAGERKLVRTSFHFELGIGVSEKETGIRPDFVIHSHQFDPGNPGGYTQMQQLGINYPSIMDRHVAKDALRDAKGAESPTQEMLLHGDQVFHIHGHDLNFSLLDPDF